MGKQIPNATYEFDLPFLFCGEEYYNSADLAIALIEHWDIGLMAAKRGEFAAFFDYLAEEDSSFQNIADISRVFFIDLHRGGEKTKDVREDLEYSKFLCRLEENIPGIPVIRYGETKGETMGRAEWDSWRDSFEEEQREMPTVVEAEFWNAWIWTTYNCSELKGRINEEKKGR